MEEEVEWLKNRVAVLEEMVECLLGKAIADSGEMDLLLRDIVAISSEPPASDDEQVIADHRHIERHMKQRLSGAEFRSGYFPRRWTQAKRLRETYRPR